VRVLSGAEGVGLDEMQKKNFIRLNTVLRSPPGVGEAITALSREIAETYDEYFILDAEQFFPHVTIYAPEYPSAKQSNVLSSVEAIALKTSRLTLGYVGTTSKQGYVGLRMKLTDEMRDLHIELVEKLNPLRGEQLRAAYREDAADYQMRFSDDQKGNIKKYGFPEAMSLYNPHMTVIRLKDEAEAKEVAERLSWIIDSFEFTQLGVYAMGDHGTCIEELAAFDLQ